MKQITSDQNPTLRKAIRLHESRCRRQQQRIIIFGLNEIRLAQQTDLEFSEVFVCDSGRTDAAEAIVERFRQRQVPLISLSKELFAKLTFGARNEAIVAIANRPDRSLATIRHSDQAMMVVVEAIEKPGNVGAVFRSADAAGATAVLLADVRCDAFHPNSIRASLGTVFSVPWAVASSQHVRQYLLENQIQIAAAKVDAERRYFDVDMTRATAMVLGSEHEGLSDCWNDPNICDVKIPMLGTADSLNISASASILLFEAQRQRLAGKSQQKTESTC